MVVACVERVMTPFTQTITVKCEGGGNRVSRFCCQVTHEEKGETAERTGGGSIASALM